ncbi:MAG TPA: holo-[acyl-carrier-protein] synthase [Treponema sp.]|jgi:holo-[acyl-carrier protein] synthase|nr:holo-[acyl-carrier-protein] synthase [Treponema sp.]HBD68825.1 holo-[acyl-carrier-protein] synthase [Treponema sp.]
MVCGIGVDMAKVSRFLRWVKDPKMIDRYFNKQEQLLSQTASEQRRCEWYAVRFAAKEAFSKALGTGLNGFDLCDIYIVKDESGMPSLCVTGRALSVLHQKCGQNARVFVSLTHEKEYALAFVTIEGTSILNGGKHGSAN